MPKAYKKKKAGNPKTLIPVTVANTSPYLMQFYLLGSLLMQIIWWEKWKENCVITVNNIKKCQFDCMVIMNLTFYKLYKVLDL